MLGVTKARVRERAVSAVRLGQWSFLLSTSTETQSRFRASNLTAAWLSFQSAFVSMLQRRKKPLCLRRYIGLRRGAGLRSYKSDMAKKIKH